MKLPAESIKERKIKMRKEKRTQLRSEIWWWVKEGLTCLMGFGVMGAMTVLMLMIGGR